MKPLRIKIQYEANLKKVPMHVIEKDYALSVTARPYFMTDFGKNRFTHGSVASTKKVFPEGYRHKVGVSSYFPY